MVLAAWCLLCNGAFAPRDVAAQLCEALYVIDDLTWASAAHRDLQERIDKLCAEWTETDARPDFGLPEDREYSRRLDELADEQCGASDVATYTAARTPEGIRARRSSSGRRRRRERAGQD